MEIKMNEKELVELIEKKVKAQTKELVSMVNLAKDIIDNANNVAHFNQGIAEPNITFYYGNKSISQADLKVALERQLSAIKDWKSKYMNKLEITIANTLV